MHCRSSADDNIINSNANLPSVSDGDGASSSSTNINNTPFITNNNKGGYTILIQYSLTPKSQRQYALSSTIAMHTSDKKKASTTYASLPSGMASMTLTKSPPTTSNAQKRTINNGGSASYYGMSGPFLVRQAFDELCNRCNGGVVYVSTLSTNSVLDLIELEEMSNDNNYIGDYNNNMSSNQDGYDSGDDDDNDNESNLRLLQKHQNAKQMFRRNGAVVDLSSNPFGWEDSDTEDDDDGCDLFMHKCNMNKLHPIAMSIRKAATNVESRRHHHTSLAQQDQNNKQIMQQPIPIIFESMTPVLNAHGVDKVCALLKSLGRVLQDSTNKSTILSPIVVPILYESISPSEHRCLEDVSDAMVHLNSFDSPGDSLSQNNLSSTTLSGVMDLVRRGCGGLGGKFIRHYTPFHIMRLVSKNMKDMQDSCYWVLEHDDESENISSEDKDTKKKEGTRSTTRTSKAENNKEQVSDTGATNNTSRPRIYLQDDDPEFDDFDEEEEDDDLDF